MAENHRENIMIPEKNKHPDSICWTCGQRGHSSKHCKRPDNLNYSRLTHCWNCRGKNHKRSYCRNPFILFCSFCGEVGRRTMWCRCNQLSEMSNQDYPEKVQAPEVEQHKQVKSPEKKTPLPVKTAKHLSVVTPDLPPGPRSLMIRCAIEVTISGISYEGVVDNAYAFSRINPKTVNLGKSSEIFGRGWVGVNVSFNEKTTYLLFALDETLQKNISFGIDAQLIMNFDVLILGRSIYNPSAFKCDNF